MQLFSSPDSPKPETFAALVDRLGGAEAIEALARRHSAFHRARHIKSAADLLRLILAYAPGGRSLRKLAAEAPPDIAERARDVARHNARKDQHDVDPRTLRAAGYMILITSLDAIAFPPQLLVRLYRVRWQIELAFKRLKSILRLDRLPAKDPGLARAWIAAHLLLALLIEDTTAEMADFSPSES